MVNFPFELLVANKRFGAKGLSEFVKISDHTDCATCVKILQPGYYVYIFYIYMNGFAAIK